MFWNIAWLQYSLDQTYKPKWFDMVHQTFFFAVSMQDLESRTVIYHHYSNRMVGNWQIWLWLNEIHKNFQESNFFYWIRSTAVTEAQFPLDMRGGLFAPGSVACSTKLLLAFQKCIDSGNFNRLSIVLSASNYFWVLIITQSGCTTMPLPVTSQVLFW